MKKDRNRPFGKDFSLPRVKILRGRKNFKRLFESDAQLLHDEYISLRYLIVDDSRFGCLMGFITPRRLGKANKRNRMRRLLKESYRIHQNILVDPLQAAQITFQGALIAQKTGLSFKEVEREVITLLNKVSDRISLHNA